MQTRGNSIWWGLAAFPLAAALSCSKPPADSGESRQAVSRAEVPAFLSAFQLIDSIEFEQRPELPIVRVSGLALSQDRRFALADASESNIKLFDARGQLLTVLGRSGEGPGEFRQPRFPRFDADGRLFVGDTQLNRITVFDAQGKLFTTIPLVGISPLMGLELGARGGFYLTADGREASLVHVVDSFGNSTAGYLSLDQARPRQEPRSPIWRALTQRWLTQAGGRLYVASTLSDSVWDIDPATGKGLSAHLEVPGYLQPHLPAAPPRGVTELMAWQRSFHIAGTILAGRDLLVIPFVRGVLNYGDPMVLMVRPANGPWLALKDAPPPVLVTGDSIFAILHPDAPERVVLGVFRRRAAESAASILSGFRRALAARPPTLACGQARRSPPTSYLLVTARQCLSCRGMGRLMRRLESGGAGALSVFVPAKDTAEICSFARTERVGAAVFSVEDRAYPAAALRDRFLYGMVDESGHVTLALLKEEAHEFFPDSSGEVPHPATGTSPR
jgi:hypothetical protein